MKKISTLSVFTIILLILMTPSWVVAISRTYEIESYGVFTKILVLFLLSYSYFMLVSSLIYSKSLMQWK